MPGFLDSALRWLTPGALEQSALFARLTNARLRWTPAQISFSSTYFDEESSTARYDVILELPSDTLVRSIESPRQGLETQARVVLQPFASLSADLLAPAKISANPLEREAIASGRTELAGIDIGWEMYRTLGAQVAFRPAITAWLRPALTYSSQFHSYGSPSYIERGVRAGDTTAVLQRTFLGERQLTRSVVLDPAALVEATLAAPDTTAAAPDTVLIAPEGPVARTLAAVGSALQPLELSWSGALSSHFERETSAPTLGYQLGLGSLSSFRYMAGDTAATALEHDAFRARSGLHLPLGTELDVAYGQSDAVVFELRGGRRTEDGRTWPDVRIGWPDLALAEPLRSVIPRVSIAAGYRRQGRTSRYGDAAGLEWTSEDTSVPLQVGLGFAGDVSASYTGTLTQGTSSDPTGDAKRQAVSHAAQLTARFMAPGPLRERLPNPLRASVHYTYEAESQCRVASGSTDDGRCALFIDNIRRRFDLTLDTTVSQLNVGLQMSYYDTQSFVGTRTGSSQFQLGLFGQFSLAAGEVPGGAP